MRVGNVRPWKITNKSHGSAFQNDTAFSVAVGLQREGLGVVCENLSWLNWMKLISLWRISQLARLLRSQTCVLSFPISPSLFLSLSVVPTLFTPLHNLSLKQTEMGVGIGGDNGVSHSQSILFPSVLTIVNVMILVYNWYNRDTGPNFQPPIGLNASDRPTQLTCYFPKWYFGAATVLSVFAHGGVSVSVCFLFP